MKLMRHIPKTTKSLEPTIIGNNFLIKFCF
jgi:hypothetical protein